MKIAFVGYRCSGKTTISTRLAHILSWPRVEVDNLIEDYFSLSISEIISLYGFPLFRAIENHFIKQCSCGNEQIIDPGGGAVLHADAMRVLKQDTFVFFLNCSSMTILNRMGQSYARPALTSLDPYDEIRQVLDFRLPLYKNAADFTISCDGKTVEEITGIVIAVIDSYQLLRDRYQMTYNGTGIYQQMTVN